MLIIKDERNVYRAPTWGWRRSASSVAYSARSLELLISLYDSLHHSLYVTEPTAVPHLI
jgi:hypothetical protein